MRRGGAQCHGERAVGIERPQERVFRDCEGGVAPHVVRVEPGAADPERAERHGDLARLLFPIDERDRPPAWRALDHPIGRGSVAADAPDPSGAATVVDSDRKHVFAAPVKRVGWDAVAAVRLPVAAVVRREVARLPDLYAVEERLVGVVDLAELQVDRPPLTALDRSEEHTSELQSLTNL